jgi:hypothetical protein
MQFLWPLFVLLLIGSVDKVGFLYFVVFFVSLLLTYFSGWYVDHSKGRRPFSLSGIILSGVWFVRAFVSSAWSIITIDVFQNLAESVFNPFYDSIMLRRSKGSTSLSYFTYREIIVSVSGILFWIIFVIFFLVSSSWRGFVMFGAITVLMSMQLYDRATKESEKSVSTSESKVSI